MILVLHAGNHFVEDYILWNNACVTEEECWNYQRKYKNTPTQSVNTRTPPPNLSIQEHPYPICQYKNTPTQSVNTRTPPPNLSIQEHPHPICQYKNTPTQSVNTRTPPPHLSIQEHPHPICHPTFTGTPMVIPAII